MTNSDNQPATRGSYTISIPAELQEAGKARAKAMGYSSYSAYVEHVLAWDAEREGNHSVKRTSDGIRHEIE